MNPLGDSIAGVDYCDVVVVGAGIVGAAVAARLARLGIRVAVLDAQEVAGGATGRSAGIVTGGLPGHYRWAVETFGREQAQALWRLTVEGRERLAEAAARLGMPAERSDSLALAVTPEEADSLRASAVLLQQDGFRVEFDSGDPLGRGFLAAIRQRDDVVVDAAQMARALLASAPIAVHPGTEVVRLQPEGETVRVWARRRNVRCSAVVLAVDGYASLLDRVLARWVAPGRALLATTEPVPGVALPGPCYADYGYEYVRPLAGGRLLVGAWRWPRSDDGASAADEYLRQGLARFLSCYFPQVQGRIVSRRSGIIGLTPDGLPIVGALPHLPGVYVAVGLGGWGLSWALVAAERVVESLTEGADPGLLSAGRLI